MKSFYDWDVWRSLCDDRLKNILFSEPREQILSRTDVWKSNKKKLDK